MTPLYATVLILQKETNEFEFLEYPGYSTERVNSCGGVEVNYELTQLISQLSGAVTFLIIYSGSWSKC